MNRYIILTVSLLTALLLGSCGNEDEPEITYHDPTDFFTPADSVQDATATLQRTFFKEHGSYLLFNDTLQHIPLGKDINGTEQYFTETIDMGYKLGMTSSISDFYDFNYLSTYADREAAVRYLEKFILPHFSKSLRPFSWFLAASFTGTVDGKTDKIVKPFAISGQRCIALSFNGFKQLKTDAQKQTLANRHLVIIVGSLANNRSSEFTEFYNISGNLYGTSMSLASNETAMEDLHAHGFISGSTKLNSYYPSQENDLNAFTTLVTTKTLKQMEDSYGRFPLIISKYKKMREIIERLGYIF